MIVQNSKNQSLDGAFVVFDIETTGFSPAKNKIIEIGAVRVENGILKWDILSFRIGDLPLPAALVRSYANRHFQRKFRGSPAETILAEGIVLLEADRTGNLVLRYRPRETVDAADRVCFGSANNRIRQFLNRYKK